MYAISSYRGNRSTHTQTHTHTHTQANKHTHPQTGPITIHCAAKLSAQCNNAVTGYLPECFVSPCCKTVVVPQ